MLPTFERGDDLKSDYPMETSSYRDHVLAWAKELGRSIDYLGPVTTSTARSSPTTASAGSVVQVLAVENRLKVLVLVAGGLYFPKTLPEVDQINFAPRVTAPVLMMNGRSDFFYPLETSQEPLYRLLGTPAKDKRRMVFDSGHAPPRNELIKETLNWLDLYLGPVE